MGPEDNDVLEPDAAILRFANHLRDAGVRVSPAEVADALAAVREAGFALPRFRAALRSSLIKDEADGAVFDLVFRLFFRAGSDTPPGDARSPHRYRHRPHAVSPGIPTGLGIGRSGAGPDPGPLIDAVIAGAADELARLAQLAVESVDLASSPQLELPAGLEEALEQALVSVGFFAARHQLRRRWEDRLAAFARQVRERLEEAVLQAGGDTALPAIALAANLRRKSFADLGPEEAGQMRRHVLRLGRHLAVRLSRRRRPAARGTVDLRRTVRRLVRTRGLPLDLAYRRRTLDRPDIILLCDVSGSVSPYSRFMLYLAHAIQNRCRQARTFLFIDRLDEVTLQMKDPDPEEAVEAALAGARVSVTNNSDYGEVFYQFWRDVLPLLSPRATLVVLGDAKNNGRPGQDVFLKEIARALRRVVWLNPAPASSWGTEDSIIPLYAPHCQAVYECRNLEQLGEAVRRMV